MMAITHISLQDWSYSKILLLEGIGHFVEYGCLSTTDGS